MVWWKWWFGCIGLQMGRVLLKVQQWRIERSDGAILSFGQDQELKKFVPVGTYKVEAKVVRDDNEVTHSRGTLTVTATQVLVQQRAAVKRVASANP